MESSNLRPKKSANQEVTVGRASKLRRSCEPCRTTKGKCRPSEEDSSRCQKCIKEGKQCTFQESKPRQKRVKTSRYRVAEMEERLDVLFAVLQAKQQDGDLDLLTEQLSPPKPIISPPKTESSTLSESHTPEPASPLRQEPLCSPQHFSFFSPLNVVFDNIQDVISRGIVDFTQAEEYVRLFQTKAFSFPFVIVPPQMTLDSLRREKPFSLLSVLAFSAQSNSKLQNTLELELRESLSRRVIINGEKSLDLLQGLLLYLTWYQYYFKAERHQIYQLSQMTVSMAMDLGIDKNVALAASTNFGVLSSITPFASPPRLSVEEIEVRRTFLGCYYISSSISHGFRKPNSLKYGTYMDECCKLITEAGEADSDYLIPYFIRLQQFTEEVNCTFHYDSTLQLPQLEAARMEILLRVFEQQLDQFQTTFPAEIWNNASIKMAYYSLRIYVNEVGFQTQPLSNTTHNTWYYSPHRTNILQRCLQASKSYLDAFLALTSYQVMNFTLPDFMHLIYAMLVLGAFASGCDTLTFGNNTMKESTNMVYYLGALFMKTGGLSLQGNGKGEGREFMNHLTELFSHTKNWYQNMNLGSDALACCLPISGKPEFSFLEILPSVMARGVVYSSGIGEPICEQAPDEQWTDMLSGWNTDYNAGGG